MRFFDFKQKEVINIKDGSRLGYVNDFDFCHEKGHCKCLIVPGPARVFGIFGREQEYRVSWEHVKQVGDDLILIECETDKLLKDIDVD
jgi:YlmC/YmxH family sporulation protein